MTMRLPLVTLLPAALLALASCGPEPVAPEVRPDWSDAAIDGIAPLMTPEAVTAALDRHGYRQVACASDRPVKPDVLVRGEEPGCFESESRPMRVRLNFFDLKEGRRLAIANFEERALFDKPEQQRIDSGRALARRLRARFGKPLTSTRNPSFVTLYWGRPGGSPNLPDLISTTVGAHFGANITMTSFWAYGQLRKGQ